MPARRALSSAPPAPGARRSRRTRGAGKKDKTGPNANSSERPAVANLAPVSGRRIALADRDLRKRPPLDAADGVARRERRAQWRDVQFSPRIIIFSSAILVETELGDLSISVRQPVRHVRRGDHGGDQRVAGNGFHIVFVEKIVGQVHPATKVILRGRFFEAETPSDKQHRAAKRTHADGGKVDPGIFFYDPQKLAHCCVVGPQISGVGRQRNDPHHYPCAFLIAATICCAVTRTPGPMPPRRRSSASRTRAAGDGGSLGASKSSCRRGVTSANLSVKPVNLIADLSEAFRFEPSYWRG